MAEIRGLGVHLWPLVWLVAILVALVVLVPRFRRRPRARWYPFRSDAVPAAFGAFVVGEWAVFTVSWNVATPYVAFLILCCCALWGTQAERKARGGGRKLTSLDDCQLKVDSILLARELVNEVNEYEASEVVTEQQFIADINAMFGASILRYYGEFAERDMTDDHLSRFSVKQDGVHSVYATAYALERLAQKIPENPKYLVGVAGESMYERYETHVSASLSSVKNALGRDAAARSLRAQPAGEENSLKLATLRLSKDIRRFRDSIPAGLSREAEFDLIWTPFFTEHHFFERLTKIKDRLRNVSRNQWHVAASTEWDPMSRDDLRKIADALEREALNVDPDIPD